MCVSTLMHSFITNATKNQAPKADPTKANRGVWEGASGAAAAAPVVYKCMGRKPGAKKGFLVFNKTCFIFS